MKQFFKETVAEMLDIILRQIVSILQCFQANRWWLIRWNIYTNPYCIITIVIQHFALISVLEGLRAKEQWIFSWPKQVNRLDDFQSKCDISKTIQSMTGVLQTLLSNTHFCKPVSVCRRCFLQEFTEVVFCKYWDLTFRHGLIQI